MRWWRREILALCSPRARLEAVGKRAGRKSPRQLEINQRLIDLARQNLRVVRLKGGDPLVFGRGGEEALALAAAGVPFRIVPGVTAGHGALAYAGIPATHRGRAQSVAFVTGHHAGGGEARDVDWAALARGARTLVLYMALQRLPAIAEALLAAGRDPHDPVAILCDATTPRQRLLRTTLAEAAAVAAKVDRSSATLIAIGPVVALERSSDCPGSRWRRQPCNPPSRSNSWHSKVRGARCLVWACRSSPRLLPSRPSTSRC